MTDYTLAASALTSPNGFAAPGGSAGWYASLRPRRAGMAGQKTGRLIVRTAQPSRAHMEISEMK